MITLLRQLAILFTLWQGHGGGLAARAWQIIDSAYVIPGFDRRRWRAGARLVGQPTFGKALIHALAPLDADASLLLTVGRIETLAGHPILAVGLKPDVVASDASAQSVAIGLLEAMR